MNISWGDRSRAVGTDHSTTGRMWLRGVVATLVTAALAFGGLIAVPAAVADTAPAAGTPETVSSDPLPTVQIDGVVYAQEIIGNTVYVGGNFANARPAGAAAGTNLTPRQNLLAYDLTTGRLITSWNPGANGTVFDIKKSPDGSRFYVAGSFSQVNGQWRYRVAAFDSATGALITTWSPEVNGRVDAIDVTDDTVYLAGEFSAVNGTQRTKVAAVSRTDGSVRAFSANVAGGYGAKGIVVSPDRSKVVIAGSFTSVNGSTNPGRGITALTADTGTTMPWAMNSILRNAGEPAAMYSLSADADGVYGTGFTYGGTSEDGFEGAFRANWSDGSLIWMQDCHGDSYDVAPVGDVVYVVSHAHYCGNIGGFPQTEPWTFNHSLAFSKAPTGQLITPDVHGYKNYTGQQAPSLLHWYPQWVPGTYTGISQAAWQVTGNDDYVIFGGEFPRVNGLNQQGIVRFAKKSLAPNKMGPQTQGGAWALSGVSFQAGEIRLSWSANYDSDNQKLHYALMRRDKGATPVYETDAPSNFWTLPTMSFRDKSVTAGQSYDYRIVATDAFGNSTQSDWTSVTAAASGTTSAYDEAIIDDAPTDYWPLDEGSGTVGYDWSGGSDLNVQGVTRGTAGPNLTTPKNASTFGGTSSSYASTRTATTGPQVFTVEAWFRTNSTRGGKIVGFGSAASGSSSSYDRQIYLDNSGRVTFGVYPGETRTISSGTGFNNNQWHHVVGVLSPAGQVLYVDGVKIGERADTTSAQAYSGYWRIGGDSLGSWPNVGSSTFLSGAIANVAVYDRALTRREVDEHWVASGRASALAPAPADLYGKSVHALDPTLYWRLGETTGTTAADAGLNGSTGTYNGAVVKNETGALSGVSNAAARWNPTRNAVTGAWSTARVIGTRQYANPQVFSIEAWFKSTSTYGGKIVGFGDAASGLSTNYDRHIYMSPDGRLNFGVYNNSSYTISSTDSFNNGQWHHVVGQLSGNGMAFYVDGVLVGTNPNTVAQNYNGYWRVGNDNGWEGATTFTGTIDEVAVYGAPLTATQIAQHYELGRTGAVNNVPTASFSSLATDLTVAFDAAASTDSDGTIASYAWDFGDGKTGTGVAPTHAYTAAGSYTVTLKVTDDRGGIGTISQPIVVQAPNVPPTAEFAIAANNLSVDVDATASADPDGTIATYSWAFGDGAVATGATASHAYATAGTFTVTLTVTDNRGASVSTSQQVTTNLPPNTLPTASFSTSVTDLALAVDASTSSDSDGSITSYAWDFGDTTTGTGVTATHQYAVAGVYTVTLTVTDNRGGSTSTTRSVTATNPPQFTVIANDSFERSVSNGWGTAEKGGAWTTAGGNASFSVVGGAGRIMSNLFDTRTVSLNGVSATNVDVSSAFSVDRTGAGYSWTLVGRKVGAEGYSARVRFEAGNIARLYILRGETAIGTSYVLPGTYAPGEVLNVRLQVKGTSPTTVQAKVWKASTAEPAAWSLSGTDSTPALQSAGSLSLFTYLSGSSATSLATMNLYSLSVVDPTAPTAPNQVPVASFVSSVAGLKVSVDGSGSSDPDGSVASYSWNFGDGGSATGATASHTYAAAGTFTVTLTVTDDRAGTSSTSRQVTVAPAPNQAPVASFTSATSALSVTVNGSGSTDADGTVTGYAWNFGDGGSATGATASHTYAAAGTFTVTLTVTDNAGATHSTSQSVTVAAPPAASTLATDAFERTVAAGGWGSADVGGAWSLSGGAGSFSVAGGKGQISLAPSHTRQAMLSGLSTDAVVRVAVSSDVVAASGAATANVIGRQVGASAYQARVRWETNGQVRMYLLRDETSLGSFLMPGLTYTPGMVLNVAISVTGTSPTTVSAKIWQDGTAEPAAWQVTATDTTAAMQAPGAVGFKSTVSSASTNPTTVISYDNLTAVLP